MWDLTEFVTLVGVALFSGFSLSEEVKVVKKNVAIEVLFQNRVHDKYMPQNFQI